MEPKPFYICKEKSLKGEVFYKISYNEVLSYADSLEGVARRILSNFNFFPRTENILISFEVEEGINLIKDVPVLLERLDATERLIVWDWIKRLF